MTSSEARRQYMRDHVRANIKGSIDGWTDEEILRVFAMQRTPAVSFEEYCALLEIQPDSPLAAPAQAQPAGQDIQISGENAAAILCAAIPGAKVEFIPDPVIPDTDVTKTSKVS